jgi:hypothetical protein
MFAMSKAARSRRGCRRSYRHAVKFAQAPVASDNLGKAPIIFILAKK